MTAHARTAPRPARARPAEKPALTTLQPFLFPDSPEALELYVRLEQGEILYEPERLRVTPGAKLSFDTYLNSFYEAHWVRHTSVDQLELVLEGKGQAWCTVGRESPVAGRVTVARRPFDLDLYGEARISIPLQKPGQGSPGRLFVRLDVGGSGLRLDRAAWSSPTPYQREVSLGVGVCSFNREEFVAHNVERLLGAAADVRRVCVVNQGRPLTSPRMQGLRDLEPLRLRVVQQPNFGGAGGFARAALELLADPEITHLVFMDDDVLIEPAHLTTTAAFLSYSVAPLVLGGQMLDLFERFRMAEAGAVVTPDNVVIPNHQRLDLRDQASLRRIARLSPTHFNGWWFAAIPADSFRALGLPMPIFIRGDDLEYGVRLLLGRVPTVSLPPVSVWHEPFYARPGGWKYYYDLRNRLIFASVHPEHSRLEGPSRLAKILLAMVVRYDYQHVEIIRRAVSDYLRGPDLLEEVPERRHDEVQAALDRLAPEPLDDAADLPAATPGPASPGRRQLRLFASLLRALAGSPASDPAGVECRVEPDAPHHRMKLGRSYVIAEPSGHYCARLRYSWSRSWTSLFAAGPVILRYALRRRAVAARWAAAYPELVRCDRWRLRLGLRDEGERSWRRTAGRPDLTASAGDRPE